MNKPNLIIPNANAPQVKIGDNVKVPDLDIIGEVIEISNEVPGLITRVRDSRGNVHEVMNLVVVALGLASRIIHFFDKLFRKKK